MSNKNICFNNLQNLHLENLILKVQYQFQVKRQMKIILIIIIIHLFVPYRYIPADLFSEVALVHTCNNSFCIFVGTSLRNLKRTIYHKICTYLIGNQFVFTRGEKIENYKYYRTLLFNR